MGWSNVASGEESICYFFPSCKSVAGCFQKKLPEKAHRRQTINPRAGRQRRAPRTLFQTLSKALQYKHIKHAHVTTDVRAPLSFKSASHQPAASLPISTSRAELYRRQLPRPPEGSERAIWESKGGSSKYQELKRGASASAF